MKRFLTLATAFATALILLSSCSEKEDTHTYFTAAASTFTGDDLDKVMGYFTTEHPYFSETHSYFGLTEDCNNQAFIDFADECERVDDDVVVSMLPEGGSMVLYLYEQSSGQVVAQSQAWVYKDPVDVEAQ